VSDEFEGLGTSLAFNGASMAVSALVAAFAFPSVGMLGALLPFALGALGLYHYVRARSSRDGAATEHHGRLCSHFGLVAISIAGCLVTVILFSLYFIFKD
jgi:hypothetical protein